MNILLVTGPDISLKEPFSSGIESFVVTLANKLVMQGHVVDVIAKDAEPDVSFNIISLPERPFKQFMKLRLSSTQKVKNQLQAFSRINVDTYDVIHYNLFIPELYTIARQFDKPSVLTLHSPVDKLRSAVYRAFAHEADVTFVAISERIEQQWSAALNVSMPVLRNGISMDAWPARSSTAEGYLLWSGRINSQKNVVAAIRLARHTGRPLKIAGRIVDQDYFDREVRPLLSETIEYVGHTTQRQLSELAKGASVFLATAQWCEPFGLAALEMLASGIPVIGFETAIPPDLRKAGISMTAPSGDWHDLVGLLEQVASATPESCRSFAQTLDDSTMAEAYGQLYGTLVRRRDPILAHFDGEVASGYDTGVSQQVQYL